VVLNTWIRSGTISASAWTDSVSSKCRRYDGRLRSYPRRHSAVAYSPVRSRKRERSRPANSSASSSSQCRNDQLEALDQFFSILTWIPVDEGVARVAGELARRHRKSHSGIDDADYLIAATALLLDAELLTSNVRQTSRCSPIFSPRTDVLPHWQVRMSTLSSLPQRPWQRLYFRPEPHGQGSFRPTLVM
jgi:hypothetical protein